MTLPRGSCLNLGRPLLETLRAPRRRERAGSTPAATQRGAAMPPRAMETPQGRATPSPFTDRLRGAQGPPLGARLQPGKRVPYNDASNTTSSSLSLDQLDSLRRQSNLSTLSLSPRRPTSTSTTTTTRQPRPSFSFGVQVNDDESLDGDEPVQGDDDAAAGSWTTVDRMRCWRNDAMTQHLYDSAKFWGAKVFGMTGRHRLFAAGRVDVPSDRWLLPPPPPPPRRQPGRRILARPDLFPDAPVCAS